MMMADTARARSLRSFDKFLEEESGKKHMPSAGDTSSDCTEDLHNHSFDNAVSALNITGKDSDSECFQALTSVLNI